MFLVICALHQVKHYALLLALRLARCRGVTHREVEAAAQRAETTGAVAVQFSVARDHHGWNLSLQVVAAPVVAGAVSAVLPPGMVSVTEVTAGFH